MPGIEEFTAAFFDASSAAWRSNKIQKPDCTYAYKCIVPQSDGSVCGMKAHANQRCWRHRSEKWTAAAAATAAATTVSIKTRPRPCK